MSGSLYRYYKWTITLLKTTGYEVQAAEFQFFDKDYNRIYMNTGGFTISNPGGSSPVNEEIQKLIDNNTNTKWLNYRGDQIPNTPTNVIIDFGANYNLVANPAYYRWVTANDFEGRDPKSWILYGSLDNSTWDLLDSKTNYSVTSARFTAIPESGYYFTINKLDYTLEPPFRYFKCNITNIRNISLGLVQMAEFKLYNSSYQYIPKSDDILLSSPNSTGPVDQTIQKIMDNNVLTKWHDMNGPLGYNNRLGGFFIIDLGINYATNQPYYYKWITAEDIEGRDPITWQIYGSNNMVTWNLLDLQTNFSVTTTRNGEVPGNGNYFSLRSIDSLERPFKYFKYICFQNKQLVEAVQISEFKLYNSIKTYIPKSVGISLSNPTGAQPYGYDINKIMDNTISTKWYDSNGPFIYYRIGGYFLIDMGTNYIANQPYYYSWITANDVPNRDPITWRIYGSNDNLKWKLLDSQTNYTVSASRNVEILNNGDYFTLGTYQEPQLPNTGTQLIPKSFYWFEYPGVEIYNPGISDSDDFIYNYGSTNSKTITIYGQTFTLTTTLSPPYFVVFKLNKLGSVKWLSWFSGSNYAPAQISDINQNENKLYLFGTVDIDRLTVYLNNIKTEYLNPQYQIPSPTAGSLGTYVIILSTIDGSVLDIKWIYSTNNGSTNSPSIVSVKYKNNYIYAFGKQSSNSIRINSTNYSNSYLTSSSQAFIVKFNLNLTISTVNWIASTSFQNPISIILDNSNSIYIQGFTLRNFTININGVTYTAPNNTKTYPNVFFIIKLNSSYQFQWLQWFPTQAIFNMNIDNNNNFFLSGNFDSSLTLNGTTYNKPSIFTNTGYDCIIIKFNSSGTVLFLNWIPSNSGNNIISDLIFDTNNNFYISGNIAGDSILLNSNIYTKPIIKSGLELVFIARYSESNTLEWFRWLGGNQSDFGGNLIIDNKNNLTMYGGSNSTSITFDSITYNNPNPNITPPSNYVFNSFVTKYYEDIPPTPSPLPTTLRPINLLWLDGIGDDYAYQTAIDSNGFIYYVGFSSSSTIQIGEQTFTKPEGSTYNYGLFFCKINPTTQAVVWIKWVDTNKNEFGYSINITNNDKIIIIGQTDSQSVIIDSITYTKYNNTQSYFVLVYDTDGLLSTLKWIGFTEDINNPRTLTISNKVGHNIDNEILITGNTNSTSIIIDNITYNNTLGIGAGTHKCFLIKLSIINTVLSVNWLGGSSNDYCTGVVSYGSDNTDDIFLIGYSYSNDFTINSTVYAKPSVNTNSNTFIIKLNSSFTVQWFNWIDSSSDNFGKDITIDISDNICILGTSQSSITIDSTEYTKPELSTTNTGSFIVKYLNDGTFSWIFWVDGDLEDIGYSLVTDYYEDVYLVGQSTSTSITLDLNTYTKSNNLESAFFLKLLSDGTFNRFRWIGGNNMDNAMGVVVDLNSNINIIGSTKSSSIIFGSKEYIKPTHLSDVAGFICIYSQVAETPDPLEPSHTYNNPLHIFTPVDTLQNSLFGVILRFVPYSDNKYTIKRFGDIAWYNILSIPTYHHQLLSSSNFNNSVVTVNLTSDFKFYGCNYSTIHICTNGHIMFGSSYDNISTPTINPFLNHPRIAVFLDYIRNGDIYYGYMKDVNSTENDMYIVTLSTVFNEQQSGGFSECNFQLILYLENALPEKRGLIDIKYGSCYGDKGLVGLSDGTGFENEYTNYTSVTYSSISSPAETETIPTTIKTNPVKIYNNYSNLGGTILKFIPYSNSTTQYEIVHFQYDNLAWSDTPPISIFFHTQILQNAEDALFNISLNTPFTFYGVTYNTLSVCTNGFITLGSNQDIYNTINLETHFASPRISPFYTHYSLNPDNGGGGSIYYGYENDTDSEVYDMLVITFIQIIVHYDTPRASGQIILYLDNAHPEKRGTVRINYGEVNVQNYIVGLSDGIGNDYRLVNFDLIDSQNDETQLPSQPRYFSNNFKWIENIIDLNDIYTNKIKTDSLGNVYVCGYTSSSSITIGNGTYTRIVTSLGTVGYIFKTNPTQSQVLWFKWLSATDFSESCINLEIDSSNNVYVTLNCIASEITIDTVTYTSSNPLNSSLILFFNGTNGSVIDLFWVYGLIDFKYIKITRHLSDSNTFYITGSTSATSVIINNNSSISPIAVMDGYKIFICKITNILPNNYTYTFQWMGGLYDDYCMEIKKDSQDNLYISGYTYSENFYIGNTPYTTGFAITILSVGFLIKLNATNLTYIWGIFIRGYQYSVSVYSHTIDNSDNIIIAGYSQDYLAINDGTSTVTNYNKQNEGIYGNFVIKFNKTDGTLSWIKWIENNIYNDIDCNVVSDDLDNIYLLSNLYDESLASYLITKYNSLGIVIYSKNHVEASNMIPRFIDVDNQYNIYVTGYTPSLTVTLDTIIYQKQLENNTNTGFIVKYSSVSNSPEVLRTVFNVLANDIISLPLFGNVNVRVYWGDDSNDTYTTPGIKTHQYTYAGNYNIIILGTLEQFGNGLDSYPNIEKLISIDSFGTLGLTSLSGAFKDAVNLISIPSFLPSTLTNLEYMFYGATSINDPNILLWDMSNVTDISYMFFSAESFNQNIFNWNIPINVNVNKKFLLYGAKAFNQPYSGWLSIQLEDLGNHS